jgi:hypothetical protein
MRGGKLYSNQATYVAQGQPVLFSTRQQYLSNVSVWRERERESRSRYLHLPAITEFAKRDVRRNVQETLFNFVRVEGKKEDDDTVARQQN